MTEQNGHITLKVIMGYMLLILLAVCSVVYIYNIIDQVSEEEDPDKKSRQKIYLVTNTLSLLYESEAMGQLIGMPENEFKHFNQKLDKALKNMNSLRELVTDSSQLLKIDTINDLLQQKRRNTRLLLETWNETNTERLYDRNIEDAIARQDTIIKQMEVQERIIIKQDTIITPQKTRGFFRRLAEVFVPEKGDSSVKVNTTRQIVTDTLLNAFNPSDTIVSVLKDIQSNVADQRKQLLDVLLMRAANLRYSNSVITSKINQMLRDIEEEDMNISFERMQKKQSLLRDSTFLIAGIAIISLIVVVIFIIMITRDVSRSKYYREQLEKAKLYAENLLHSREKMMLTISHDIRAPLSSIIGYIELLSRRKPDERQRYYLENMTGSSNHILSLVNDLLDFHRLESGQMEIHPVPFSISALFQEIYTSFRPLAEAKGLDFVLNLKEEGIDRIYSGDPIRIRQVVGNLLSNAIKFTREGRVVMVVKLTVYKGGSTMDAEDRQWCANGYQLVVCISDTGSGIPEEERERIFGEFTRLSETEKEEGFGLGLSITRKLIELMGGKLSLDSTLGKGSDFEILLPLSLSDVQALSNVSVAADVETDISIHTDREIHCLLVDDDPLQLALTEEFLKHSRIQVVCCTNPFTVSELLKETSFDVIITDIQMPGMDGYQLLQVIRTSGAPGGNTVPVIALSASLAKESGHYMEVGFTGFLNKPFTGVRLISLLNELLKVDINPIIRLNFDSLTAFAGDDKKASATILRSFTEETAKNIQVLQHALRHADREEAAKMSHKLIPIFTMLGASVLVGQLRILERDSLTMPDNAWQLLLSDVITQVLEVMEHTRKSLFSN